MNAQNRNEGKTSFEKFDDLMKKLLAVPKEELDKKRAEYEREKKPRKRTG